VLPGHLHAIWSLPADDADFATRWSIIRGGFSRVLPASKSRSVSKIARREKGILAAALLEHAIRDDADMARHVDYIHLNPAKHGLVSRVRDWPHGSFHRYVQEGTLPVDWGGDAGEVAGTFGE
jgi:putative transposase